jgi:Zn-dependent peptidase ImmA (M78 family)
MGLAPTDPIDPLAICVRFDVKLIKLSELDPQSPFLCNDNSPFSAVTVPRGITTAIVHNDSHHPYRQRSNICHELAHCFLGHTCTPPLTPDGERARDGGIEAEANFLAGSLLMPNEAAIHVVRSGLTVQAQGIYGVSRPMLEYRLRVSGAQRIQERVRAKHV